MHHSFPFNSNDSAVPSTHRLFSRREGRQQGLARALLNITVQVDLVFEERTVQNHVVDDFGGIADFVVAGSDWWSRRQLNTFVVTGRVGRAGSSTDHWSPSRSLMEAIVSRWSAVSSR